MPGLPQSPNPAIERAMQSVAAAVPLAAADPQRPRYHFTPPANWMNDPNGTIYTGGYYHLFYQQNPFGDTSGHKHWGHARSRDLVHWEHLPIALWPSLEVGEEQIFSGCAAITGDGTPILFYTSVGSGQPSQRRANEQWAALGDDGWIEWHKHPDNPILDLATHGGPEFEGDWRDPYIFSAAGRTFLVLGGNFGESSAVALYEAIDVTLTQWRYCSLLHSAPRTEIRFFECPNFFPLQNRAGGIDWVLLASPYRPVLYVVGDFDVDTLTFTPTTQGVLDPGFTPTVTTAHYYATNTLYAPDGRLILFGWVRGFPPGRGWNGSLALPRVLTIGPDRRPRQNPIAELEVLRGRTLTFPTQTLPSWPTIVATAAEASLEIDTTLRLAEGSSIAFYLRAANSSDPSLAITYDGALLTMGETQVPLTLTGDETLHLRLFVDRSVSELYVDGGTLAVTVVQPMPEALIDIELDAKGSVDLLSFKGWEMVLLPTA
jgi:beta-fructofuranosidase